MAIGSTKFEFVILCAEFFLVHPFAVAAQTGTARVPATVLDPRSQPVAASDKAYRSRLSGIVVDTSGAVVAGAAVQVRSADGTVQSTTHSDKNGFFMISGLPAGNDRLVVSSPGFATKEILVSIGSTEAPAPPLRRCALRLSLVPQSHAHHFRHARLLHGDAVDHIGGLHHALGVRDDEELRVAAQRFEQVRKPAHVGFVERRVDFVEHAERAGPELEDADEQRQ